MGKKEAAPICFWLCGGNLENRWDVLGPCFAPKTRLRSFLCYECGNREKNQKRKPGLPTFNILHFMDPPLQPFLFAGWMASGIFVQGDCRYLVEMGWCDMKVLPCRFIVFGAVGMLVMELHFSV